MWNHRDLEDNLQIQVENVIKANVTEYDYGTRRADQTEVIRQSNLFDEPVYIEGQIQHSVATDDWVNAWRSHATLARQAGEVFAKVVDEIAELVAGQSEVMVPYTTRIWAAKRK